MLQNASNWGWRSTFVLKQPFRDIIKWADLNLLKDFLKEGKQRVVLNGQVSTWKNINAGVPQNSILVPLLFFIYINDFTEGLTNNIKLFADDTSLLSVVYDTQTSANDINEDLKLIITGPFNRKWTLIQTLLNILMKSFLAAKQKK